MSGKASGWQAMHDTRVVAREISRVLSELREVMPDAGNLGEALELLGKLGGFFELIEMVRVSNGYRRVSRKN